jgi:hypothetical protein
MKNVLIKILSAQLLTYIVLHLFELSPMNCTIV